MSPSEIVTPGFAMPLGVEQEVSSTQSGVSWGSIIAGGVTAAAISAILLLFGTGLGLASVSPWAGAGMSATTFTVLAAIWLIIVQWVSSAFGGYMAGRLRTKWTAMHTDEVFFRDTAHGFLAWALGTLIVVGVLSGVTGSAVNNGAHVAASVAATTSTSNTYYVDLLFRENAPAAAGSGGSALGNQDAAAPMPVASIPGMSNEELRQEASAILTQGMANGGVSSTDSTYLTQLVSEKTGLAPADAQARVTDVLNRQQADVVKAKQIADASRKAVSEAAIYTFISLLIGAFIASVSGAIGGRLRDNY
jgi:hypothetical protein